MIDFHKLIVYQKAHDFNKQIHIEVLCSKEIDRLIKDQLRRASMSIQLNIAEGCSRISPADRRNFFVIARGSAFECVAIFDILHSIGAIGLLQKDKLADCAEEISKMLFALIRKK